MMLRTFLFTIGLLTVIPAVTYAADPPATEAKKDGVAAQKLIGEYSVHLDAETTAQLDEARKKAAAAGEGSLEAQLVEMLEAMAKLRVTFTATEMIASMGDERQALPYKVVSSTADTVVLDAIGVKGDAEAKERYTIRLTEQGFVMVEDDAPDKATTFLRVK